MKSRTIEIIDNHIKALEEELEWYQQRDVELQKKYKEDVTLLRDKVVELETESPFVIYRLLTQINDELLAENARLREQLRWHSVEEKPPVSGWYLAKNIQGAIITTYYSDKTDGDGWHDRPVYKWMYIPDDNQGTDCTQEGE